MPFGPGGGTDALARAFADNARKHMTQPFVINNKPGASGVIGWNTIEEFIAAAKNSSGEMKGGNSGNGSIWRLAAASVEDKTGAKFSHIPYQGAAPAVLSLLGGHIDAWRGLGAPKGTPKEVIDVLKDVAQKTMNEPQMREAMDKLALGYAYGDETAFKALIPKLNLKP